MRQFEITLSQSGTGKIETINVSQEDLIKWGGFEDEKIAIFHPRQNPSYPYFASTTFTGANKDVKYVLRFNPSSALSDYEVRSLEFQSSVITPYWKYNCAVFISSFSDFSAYHPLKEGDELLIGTIEASYAQDSALIPNDGPAPTCPVYLVVLSNPYL